MEAWDQPKVEEITVMKSARTGLTEIMNSAVGYIITESPAPTIMLRPDQESAKKWIKVDFDGLVRYTPIVAEKMLEGMQKGRKESWSVKRFVGGMLYSLGAKSGSSLRDKTAINILMDEVDGYPASVGGDDGEGDPVELAKNRALGKWNKKIMEASTPTTRGISRIERSFLQSDMRLYFVPCVHCGNEQVLVFSQSSQVIQWLQLVGRGSDAQGWLAYDQESSIPRWAEYICGSCKKPMSEGHKHEMLRHGIWRPLFPERISHRGYHISELYSPFTRWVELATAWKRANGRRELLRVFVNTRLGESFEENQAHGLSEHELLMRREQYIKVPKGVVGIWIGVDTQDTRFEVVVRGWGIDEESWFLGSYTVWGSPALKSTQKMLDAVIFQPYEHEDGYVAMPGMAGGVIGVGIDSRGHFTGAVKQYVKERRDRRVFAIAGMEGFGKSFVVRQSRNRKQVVPLFNVGTDAAKELIFDRLALADENKQPLREGPGVMHFNEKADATYFQQLTNARRVTTTSKGVPKLVWKKADESVPDDKLDCEVYALAIMVMQTASVSLTQMSRLLEVAKRKTVRKPVPAVESHDTPHQQPAAKSDQPEVPKPVPVKVVKSRNSNWLKRR